METSLQRMREVMKKAAAFEPTKGVFSPRLSREYMRDINLWGESILGVCTLGALPSRVDSPGALTSPETSVKDALCSEPVRDGDVAQWISSGDFEAVLRNSNTTSEQRAEALLVANAKHRWPALPFEVNELQRFLRGEETSDFFAKQICDRAARLYASQCMSAADLDYARCAPGHVDLLYWIEDGDYARVFAHPHADSRQQTEVLLNAHGKGRWNTATTDELRLLRAFYRATENEHTWLAFAEEKAVHDLLNRFVAQYVDAKPKGCD